jgi:hypothetical protein
MTRKFSSISVETTLASGISNSATSMTVASGAGAALLGGITLGAGNVDQFTVALDVDTANEEIVFITAASSDTFTIVRGRAGTSAIAHSAGATVKHVLTSDDLDAFNTAVSPVSSITFSGSSSGTMTLQAASVASGVVTMPAGTATLVTTSATQTLTNKTLTAPVISTITNTGTVTLPTLTDTLVSRTATETLTNKTIDYNSNTITNLPAANLDLTLNAQTGTTYTLVAGDKNKLVTLNNASPITLTVPTNASVPYATGSQINIQQLGAGQVTVAGDTGVTVSGTGTKLRTQYSAATLIKTGTDSWTMVGDIQ